MKLSCGFLLTYNESLLLCRVTLSNPVRWDIPKGEYEPEGEDNYTLSDINERHFLCAIRELFEETGLLLGTIPYWTKEATKDLGIFQYLPNKQLHLFHFNSLEPIPADKLICLSVFERYGKSYPEVDAYKYVPFSDIINHASNKLYPVLERALNLSHV